MTRHVQVTRVVEIPPVLSLDSIKASKCRLPSTVHSDPLSALPMEEPISPIKNLSINPTPSTALATPTKFKGKSTEELTKMSEADQVLLRQTILIDWSLIIILRRNT